VFVCDVHHLFLCVCVGGWTNGVDVDLVLDEAGRVGVCAYPFVVSCWRQGARDWSTCVCMCVCVLKMSGKGRHN
jgi:hypothetical protein